MKNHTETFRSRAVWAATVLAAALGSTLAIASQPGLPKGRLPAGFAVQSTADNPSQVSLKAAKPHGVKACIHVDPDTKIGYSWTAMPEPATQTVIAGMIHQEQESSANGGITTDPAGREEMDGGTLLYKKTTILQVGTNCAPWVTYDGTWIGESGGGLLVVVISNVPKSKDAIRGWIAAMLGMKQTSGA